MPSRELVIQSTPKGADIALLEDKRLIELHSDNTESNFLVGDIYLGRVKKILPGLNAAFVDIGHERDAFLHYLDLGPNIPTQLKFFRNKMMKKETAKTLENIKYDPEIQKSGKINQVLSSGQEIVVQIVKEPISTKGPRLSTQLTLSGRYIILIPFSNTINLSKRIAKREERERLKRLINSIRPANFGVIVRTIAEGKMVAELDRDLRNLMAKWDLMMNNLEQHKHKLLGELDKKESILRDLLNDSFSKIVVDNQQYYQQIKEYIQRIAPDKEGIVKISQPEEPLFKSVGIDKQIKTLFGKIVNLTGGAYLVIEHTEAMHVIDVNSGSRRLDTNQEENALQINLEAAREVARQIRLRDLGGIIIVDFIDMRHAENRKKLFEYVKDVMQDDRAKHTILPITKFGLIQITRQRVKPEVNIDTTQKCPLCKGTGESTPAIVVIDEIEGSLRQIKKDAKATSVKIVVHPFVYAHLTHGLPSIRVKWMAKYKLWLKIVPDEQFFITKYEMNTNSEA